MDLQEQIEAGLPHEISVIQFSFPGPSAVRGKIDTFRVVAMSGPIAQITATLTDDEGGIYPDSVRGEAWIDYAIGIAVVRFQLQSNERVRFDERGTAHVRHNKRLMHYKRKF